MRKEKHQDEAAAVADHETGHPFATGVLAGVAVGVGVGVDLHRQRQGAASGLDCCSHHAAERKCDTRLAISCRT